MLSIFSKGEFEDKGLAEYKPKDCLRSDSEANHKGPVRCETRSNFFASVSNEFGFA